MKLFDLRKIVSLVAFWTLVLLLISSVAVFIAPKGRIAEQTDWEILGLGRYEWNALHLNVGLLFLLSGILHLYYNWKRFFSYLKTKGGKLRILTLNFILATLLTGWVSVGAIKDWPPFGSLTSLRSDFKQGRCGISEEKAIEEQEEQASQEGGSHSRGHMGKHRGTVEEAP